MRRWEPAGLPGATERLVAGLWDALETVRTASTDRDESRVDVPSGLRRELRWVELRGAFSWQSPQFRHAIRCGIGVMLALVVASFRPGDPLTVSFLLATFAIMQFALLCGFAVMQTRPTVFNGCMVLMSVGMNATAKHLDPRYVLVEYLLLMVLAGAIALLFGFAAIPGVPKPGPAERFGTAISAPPRSRSTACSPRNPARRNRRLNSKTRWRAPQKPYVGSLSRPRPSCCAQVRPRRRPSSTRPPGRSAPTRRPRSRCRPAPTRNNVWCSTRSRPTWSRSAQRLRRSKALSSPHWTCRGAAWRSRRRECRASTE